MTLSPWLFLISITMILIPVYAVEFLPQFIRRNQQQLQPLSSSREEYWNVRREIRRIEERMTRYQTGRNADPDHWVPYENHPYENMEQTRKRRSLQDTDPTSGNFTNEEALFRPIRIVFYTQALDDMRDSTNAAKIDWYKNTILPLTRHFWTAALSVVPVSGNLRITSGELDGFSYCGDSEFTQVPNEHKNTGVPDADLVLYVSGSPSSRFCPARTLAVAVPCNFDQFDRPTAGAINVCLDTITLKSDGTASPDVVQDYVDVTIHEVGHVLGMSSNSFRFFWDSETGQPRTARPFSEKTVTCVDGNSRTLILPDENTLVFHEEEDGSRYASIVTPKVQAIARNQFNCQEMIGAHLENQDTRDDSCFGDHWDERFFYPEAMSAVISPTTNVFSSLTLALMEDTGWYLSNYSISRMSSFGLGAGCDFVKNKCLQIDESGNTVVPNYSKGYFCNQGAAKGCSAELTHKLACTVLDYSFYVPQELPAAQYQYFPNEPSKGGPEQADYCPVFGTTYNNLRIDQLDCTNPSNTPSLNVYSEVYGEDSKCITSTAGEGLCFRTACIKEDRTLRINVLGEWIVCEEDFQSHVIVVGQGLVRTTVFCPRLAQACPDLFCPFNCAGRGVCNYSKEVNGTVQPACECFDSNDKSEACSDSMIPDGGYLNDAGGLINNLEEKFFDPLIAVFVDHPDAWTTASWAWAAGLIAVFFILMLCICSSVFPQRPRKTSSV